MQDPTKLRESLSQFMLKDERFLAFLEESSIDGFWCWEPDGTELPWTRVAYLPLLGYEAQELTSGQIQWEQLIAPKDLEEVQKSYKEFIEGDDSTYKHTIRYIHKDASPIWIEIKAFNHRGTTEASKSILGISYDVTETKLKELENLQLSTILKEAQAITKTGAWEMNLGTGQTYWTDEVYNIHDVPLDFDHNKVNGIEFYHPDYRPIITDAITRSIAEQSSFDEICKFISATGNEKWVRATGHPVMENGQVVRLFGVFFDISQQRQIEEDLNQALQVAEAANNAKSEFLANMSHELRTPLNAVIGFTELLEDTTLDESQTEFVHDANVAGHVLLNTINDILDFSKIDTDMLTLEVTPTSLKSLIEESFKLVKLEAQKKHLDLKFIEQTSYPDRVHTDPFRMKQIFINLLNNAIKFTEQGSVEFRVEFHNESATQGKFRFSVKDTGVGIEESQIDKLFKAFSQADTSTTRMFGGTGLGLIISDSIAQKMGSKIHVKSKLHEGAEFYFDVLLDFEEEG